MADPKKTKTVVLSDNPVEQLTELGKGIASDIADVPIDIFNSALEQIGLKSPKKPLSGEINLRGGQNSTENTPSQEVSLGRKVNQLQMVHSSEKEVFNRQKSQDQADIQKLKQELQVEIKKLEAQTAELTTEVKSMTVESQKTQPGDYYKNFLIWILHTLRDMRQRVNESRLWLNASTQKKQQRNYWSMFKKHGTSFAMSEERAIASANG